MPTEERAKDPIMRLTINVSETINKVFRAISRMAGEAIIRILRIKFLRFIRYSKGGAPFMKKLLSIYRGD